MHTVFAIYNFYLFFSDSRSEPANTPGPCLHGETIEICSSIFSLLFTILFPKFSFFHSVEKKGSHEYNTVLPFHFTFTYCSYHTLFFPLQLVRTTFKTRKDKTPRQDEIRREKDMELCPLEGEIERTQKGQVRYGALSVRR